MFLAADDMLKSVNKFLGQAAMGDKHETYHRKSFNSCFVAGRLIIGCILPLTLTRRNSFANHPNQFNAARRREGAAAASASISTIGRPTPRMS